MTTPDRDREYYVTITIPRVLAGFSDVQDGDVDTESIVDVAVDSVFSDMDEIVATFEIVDADGHTLRTVGGIVSLQEYGPSLRRMRGPVVALSPETGPS